MVVFLLDLTEALEDLVHVIGAIGVAKCVLKVGELVVQIAQPPAAGNGLVQHRASGHLFDVLAKVADGQLLRHEDFAVVGVLLAGDHPEERGLARAIGTDEPDLFTGIELERGVDEENLAAVLLADA